MALAHPLHPIDNRSRNRCRNLWVGWCVSSWWPLFPSRSSVLIYICILYVSSVIGHIYIYFLWFINCVLLSDKLSNTRMLVTVGTCFKQHFDTRYLVFYNPSPPRMFLPMDLLSEYRIQHGAIGPLYVISTQLGYSAVELQALQLIGLWRLVSWINHLPPAFWSIFWKPTFNQKLGCRFDIMDSISSFFCILQLYMSWYIISFLGFIFTS